MPAHYIVSGQKISPKKQLFAQKLRQEMTPAEKILWSHLRGHQLNGLHFRRQQIIDGFIVDFYCHSASLVIEVDGEIHQNQVKYDIEREQALQEHNLQVIRFRNEEILNNLPEVLAKIRDFCKK
jgi:very-short-patch-repair endonuclease